MRFLSDVRRSIRAGSIIAAISIIAQRVGVLLRLGECHLTGGDGEVDSDIIAVLILDRQGRFTVEGVILTINQEVRIDLVRINRDEVASGVDIVSSVCAFVSIHRFIKSRKLPYTITPNKGIVFRSCSYAAVGKTILDRAAGKTGDNFTGELFKNRV